MIFSLKNKYLKTIIENLINNTDVNQKDKDGLTPLMDALKYKQAVKIIKLLIKKTDINLKDKNGNSAWLYSLL